eukprot:352562-Chlamydomonas_euryale.AAC.6
MQLGPDGTAARTRENVSANRPPVPPSNTTHLQRAHDSWHHAQHAGVGAAAAVLRRRRLWEEAAVARPVSPVVVHSHLTIGANRRGAHQWLACQHAHIAAGMQREGRKVWVVSEGRGCMHVVALLLHDSLIQGFIEACRAPFGCVCSAGAKQANETSSALPNRNHHHAGTTSTITVSVTMLREEGASKAWEHRPCRGNLDIEGSECEARTARGMCSAPRHGSVRSPAGAAPDEVARGRVVAAVEHDVVVAHDAQRAGGRHPLGVRDNAHAGVERAD